MTRKADRASSGPSLSAKSSVPASSERAADTPRPATPTAPTSVATAFSPKPERAKFSHDDLEARLAEPHTLERQQALLREITTTLLITLVLFLGLHYSAQAVPLDGPSMQPGLYTNERVLVNSLAYTFHGPERGDVVVFHPPTAPAERYIKRVIGLPGDTVTLTLNDVIINGVTLREPYITAAPLGENENPQAQTFKLTENQYFVMGDNRTNSQDSRFFGPITQRAIIGQAEFVVWPLNYFHAIDTYTGIYSQVPDVRIPNMAPVAITHPDPLAG